MSSSPYPNGNDNPPPDPTDVANPPNNSHGNGASSSSPNRNYIPSSLSILNDIASSLSTDNMPFETNRSPATPSLVNYPNSSRDNSEHDEGEIRDSNLDGQNLEEHELVSELVYTPFIPGLDFCAEDCPCLGEIRQLKADVQTLRDELRQYRSELALVDDFRRVGMTDDVVEGV